MILISLIIISFVYYCIEGCVWYPAGVLRSSPTTNAIYSYFVHYIPAYLLDIVARLMGKKPL